VPLRSVSCPRYPEPLPIVAGFESPKLPTGDFWLASFGHITDRVYYVQVARIPPSVPSEQAGFAATRVDTLAVLCDISRQS